MLWWKSFFFVGLLVEEFNIEGSFFVLFLRNFDEDDGMFFLNMLIERIGFFLFLWVLFLGIDIVDVKFGDWFWFIVVEGFFFEVDVVLLKF